MSQVAERAQDDARFWLCAEGPRGAQPQEGERNDCVGNQHAVMNGAASTDLYIRHQLDMQQRNACPLSLSTFYWPRKNVPGMYVWFQLQEPLDCYIVTTNHVPRVSTRQHPSDAAFMPNESNAACQKNAAEHASVYVSGGVAPHIDEPVAEYLNSHRSYVTGRSLRRCKHYRYYNAGGATY